VLRNSGLLSFKSDIVTTKGIVFFFPVADTIQVNYLKEWKAINIIDFFWCNKDLLLEIQSMTNLWHRDQAVWQAEVFFLQEQSS